MIEVHGSRGKSEHRQKILDFFRHHGGSLSRVSELALRVRDSIGRIDAFIQLHTSAVCPGCYEVCCVDKHSNYAADDIIYIKALGLEPQKHDERAAHEPCRFLSATGCRLDRTIRPSGCNWYFCDALYDSMEKAEGEYAAFDAALQELADLWMELGAEFRGQFKKIYGTEL